MSSRFGICLQAVVVALIRPYYWTAYRVRSFGRMPFRRGSTLVLCNHQNDLDTTISVIQLQWNGPWNRPVYSAASRRMFEKGFIATRLPWASKILRDVNMTKLFRALGLIPIENELKERSLARYALFAYTRHGDIPMRDVFRAEMLDQMDPHAAAANVGQLFSARWFMEASEHRLPVKVLLEPHRSELIADIRSHIEPDFAALQACLASGATLFLTPEGHYSRDGRMLRLQAALERLEPLAEHMYLLGIAYDAFVGPRLSIIVRIVAPQDRSDLEMSMRAARPVTVSQLLGAWLYEREQRSFTVQAAVSGVRERLASLPEGAFIDPELRNPDRLTRKAIEGLVRLRIVVAEDTGLRILPRRIHPQFPLVDDILGYQSRFLAETVRALQQLAGATRSASLMAPAGGNTAS